MVSDSGFWIIAASFLLGAFCLEAIATPTRQPYRIVIDPGHGGIDRGATHNDLEEARLTLEVSKKLKTALEKVENVEVFLTRSRDESVSLQNRMTLAKNLQAQLFVSLHMNASLNPEAEGLEIYFQNQLPPDEDALFLAHQEELHADSSYTKESDSADSPQQKDLTPEVKTILFDLQKNHTIFESARLATDLFNQWTGKKRPPHLTLRQAPFYVLKTHQIPSVLIELGYLTHPLEAKQLVAVSTQSRMITDLARGVLKFKETSDKPEASSLWFPHAKPTKTP